MTNNLSEHSIIYDDLVIRLRRQLAWDDVEALAAGVGPTRPEGKNIFQAEVRETPWPLQGGAFRANSEDHLERFQKLFEHQAALGRRTYTYTNPPQKTTREYEVASSSLAELGSELYKLLPLSFQLALPYLIQQTFSKGHGLRLILEARAGEQADRLLSLPWELLFFEATQVYLARTPRLLVVRRLLDAMRQNPIQMVAPFNLVHVIADDLVKPLEPGLQHAECEAVPNAIGTGHYTLVADPGSFEKTIEALQARRAQIVHFLGHGVQQKFRGETTQTGSRGYLCFIDEHGLRQWVSGEQFQHVLSSMPGVQLVVLNACHGGEATAARNIALDLVYSGFPYVVAMQEAITQDAAQDFSQAFYRALQNRQGIDYAVAAGRSAIATHLPGAIDWCLPVLYTSLGLAEKSQSDNVIDWIGDWFRRPNALHPVAVASYTLAGAHLAAGIELWLRGESLSLPDPMLITTALGWLVLVPLLVTCWLLYRKELPVPTDWSRATDYAFKVRVFSAATVGVGLPMLYLVWFNVILLAGLGVWGLLGTVAQVSILEVLALGTILISYAQARSHGLAFITNAEVGEMPFAWSELLVVLAGYFFLVIPLWLFYPIPTLLRSSFLNLNLLIGVLTFFLAYWLLSVRR